MKTLKWFTIVMVVAIACEKKEIRRAIYENPVTFTGLVLNATKLPKEIDLVLEKDKLVLVAKGLDPANQSNQQAAGRTPGPRGPECTPNDKEDCNPPKLIEVKVNLDNQIQLTNTLNKQVYLYTITQGADALKQDLSSTVIFELVP